MATAKNQQNWRSNNRNKRVEVYLPPEVVAALDKLAETLGAKGRGETLAQLIIHASKHLPEGISSAARDSAHLVAPELQEPLDNRTKDQLRLARFFESAEEYMDIEYLDGDSRWTTRVAVHGHEYTHDNRRERYVLVCNDGEKWKRVYAERWCHGGRIGNRWGEWKFTPKSYRFIAAPGWLSLVDAELPDDIEKLNRIIEQNDPEHYPMADAKRYQRALAKRQELRKRQGRVWQNG